MHADSECRRLLLDCQREEGAAACENIFFHRATITVIINHGLPCSKQHIAYSIKATMNSHTLAYYSIRTFMNICTKNMYAHIYICSLCVCSYYFVCLFFFLCIHLVSFSFASTATVLKYINPMKTKIHIQHIMHNTRRNKKRERKQYCVSDLPIQASSTLCIVVCVCVFKNALNQLILLLCVVVVVISNVRLKFQMIDIMIRDPIQLDIKYCHTYIRCKYTDKYDWLTDWHLASQYGIKLNGNFSIFFPDSTRINGGGHTLTHIKHIHNRCVYILRRSFIFLSKLL